MFLIEESQKKGGSFDGNVKNLTSEKQANNLELGRVMQSSKLKILAFTQQGIDFFFQVSTVIKKAPEECGIYIYIFFFYLFYARPETVSRRKA